MDLLHLAPDTQVKIKDFETSEFTNRRGIVALSVSHIRRLKAQGLFPQSKNIRGTRMKVYRAEGYCRLGEWRLEKQRGAQMKKESTKTKVVKDTPLVAKLIVSSNPSKTQGIIPFYPKKCGSVAAWVLAHLLQGREITQKDALYLYGTSRLSSVIHHLRHRLGFQRIITQTRAVKTHLGKSADIGVYSFPESYLSSLDSEARENYITEAMNAWKQAKASKGEIYE